MASLKTFGRMETVSALAGIGYQLDKSKQSKSFDVSQENQEDTSDNEITLFVGRTITNSFESERSTALSIEYRRRLLHYLDWTLAWLREGDSRLIRRDGMATQLWLVKDFMADRITLGFGAWAYVAVDRQAKHDRDDDRGISAIGRVYQEVRKRSRYVVKKTYGFE